jgi:hypothetical protein
MIYSPDNVEDAQKVGEFFRTMALSAATVDHPLREIDGVVLVLDWALASIQEQALRIATSKPG